MTAGDLYDPLQPPVDPFPALDTLREQCPAHRTGSGIVHTVGFDAVSNLLGDDVSFSSRSSRPPAKGEAEQLLHLDGEPHVRMRRLVNKALPKRVMTQSQDWIEELVADLLQPALDAGSFDLVSTLSQPLPAIVFFRLLGLPEDDRVRFIGWADEAVDYSHRSEEPPSHADFMAYTQQRVELCRKDPGEDILSRLVHTTLGDDRLTDSELAAMVRILIVAGTETTTNALSTLFHRLLAQRELWEKVRADESLVAVAVEEALRIDPPLSWVPRIAAGATELYGVDVPAGCVVAANLASANHDPARYSDPHDFRLDRTTAEPTALTFGYGPHYCLGAPLARTELKAALRVALRLLPGLRLADDYVFAPRGPLMMRGARELPVEAR